MQKLSGIDEMFLALDTDRTIGHVAGIGLFTAPARRMGGPDRVEFVRSRIAERLPTLPPLRWKLESTPLGLDSRRWVEVDHVDLDVHVRGVRMPAGSTEADFVARLNAIMEIPLERDRPMWEMYVIEGIAGRRYAYLFKITHGVADGSTLWTIFDHLSDAPVQPVQASAPDPEADAGPLTRLRRGLTGAATRPVTVARLGAGLATWAARELSEEKLAALPATVARISPGRLSRPLAALANRLNGDAPDVAPLFPTVKAPDSPFNGELTGRLSIVNLEVPIAQLRRAGRVCGGTINDGLLAAITGALRDYMIEHGGVGGEPLVSSVPISWRTGQEKERWANQIWMLFVPLPVHIVDPVARQAEVLRQTGIAKANWARMPAHLLREGSGLLPGELMHPAMQAMVRIPDRLTPRLFNLSVSNVKGPAAKPAYGGVVMDNYLVYGFLAPGVGLLAGCMSYGDICNITLTGCPDVVTDLAGLSALIRTNLDAILSQER